MSSVPEVGRQIKRSILVMWPRVQKALNSIASVGRIEEDWLKITYQKKRTFIKGKYRVHLQIRDPGNERSQGKKPIESPCVVVVGDAFISSYWL